MFTDLAKTMRLAVVAIVVAALAGIAATPSVAQPMLKIYAPLPDTITGAEKMRLVVAVENVGDTPTTGPIAISDTADAGTGPAEYQSSEVSQHYYGEHEPVSCETSGSTLTCTTPESLLPGAQIYIWMNIPISPEASGVHTNTVTASAGGVDAPVTVEHQTSFTPPGAFGFTEASAALLTADGRSARRAASAPASFATTLEWRSFTGSALKGTGWSVLAPVERFKDVIAHLPPGFVGNPSATEQLCTADELAELNPEAQVANCPRTSQIGIVHVDLEGIPYTVGLYNMVAPYGVATELGFEVYQTNVLLYAYVRPTDHGIDIVSRNTSTSAPITGVQVVVWGDPANQSHDPVRGVCLDSLQHGGDGQLCPTYVPRKAFLRNPTSCSGVPLQFGIESNSYEKLDTWASRDFTGPTMTRCDLVPFAPSINVDPTGTAANSPTGVNVKLSLPQTQNPDGLATADLKKAVVTLPEGMAINPSSADGLDVCDDAHLRLGSSTPADCPDGSKIGTVLLHTQLIPNPIEGLIYLRPQASSDPMSGKMFRMVLELRDDSHGLDFKVPGQIQANPLTGRLTTTFDDNPQFPFEDISLKFKAGARAPLVTPVSCTTQTTDAELYSWAQPDVAVHRDSSFQLTSGPEGTPCPPPSPFSPSFTAGVGSVEAGSYTPFLSTFSRKDSDQSMQRVSVILPKGLLGSLVGLPLCGEAQANAGTCGADSQIGTVTAGAGAGPTPFYVTGGKVYMTGSYEGAPFGLSVAVPAKAGPFDLGTVVVRAKVEVDIHTAQLTVATDPLPQVVGGVPVNLRLVNVTIDRPNFTYNPTNCTHTEVIGTMTGGEGAVATVAKGFQVTNCSSLGFKPKFSVSTNSKTSRAKGASLYAKLSYPKARPGTQTNIAKVKVSLPKQLPSRLTTLQKACPAETFDANPATCPGPSRIGSAIAHTPVLPVPLGGPVYFVSHGGQAFPDLIIVLQGYGVTVDLVGTTFISKAGITSTTFKQVPDVPIGDFELKLPQGTYSALAANGDLCKTKLVMPTTFVAQDAVQVHQHTPIKAVGCKPTMTVLRHKIRGRALTIVAAVPSAGKLVAAGNGVSHSSAKLDKAGDATVTVVLSAAKRRFLSSHPGRRLKVAVRLIFIPVHGTRIARAVTVLMR